MQSFLNFCYPTKVYIHVLFRVSKQKCVSPFLSLVRYSKTILHNCSEWLDFVKTLHLSAILKMYYSNHRVSIVVAPNSTNFPVKTPPFPKKQPLTNPPTLKPQHPLNKPLKSRIFTKNPSSQTIKNRITFQQNLYIKVKVSLTYI